MPSYVVVGASRGLGYGWLRQLSSDPINKVIGLVRDLHRVQEKATGDSITNVHLIKADMADNDSLVAAAAETMKLTGGSLDYLIINGAYTNPDENFLYPSEFAGKEELLTNSMSQSLKVNVLGVVFSINAFLPMVRKSDIKKIAVITTGLADRDAAEKSTVPFMLTYSSMKAALNIVVTKFAAELKKEGIVVFALSPGLVDTNQPEKMSKLSEEQQKRAFSMIQEFVTTLPDFKGPITVSESVKLQMGVISSINIENTGAFLSHHGDKNWI